MDIISAYREGGHLPRAAGSQRHAPQLLNFMIADNGTALGAGPILVSSQVSKPTAERLAAKTAPQMPLRGRPVTG